MLIINGIVLDFSRSKDAHDIANQVELKISDAFENSQVIVYQDPEGLEEKNVTNL